MTQTTPACGPQGLNTEDLLALSAAVAERGAALVIDEDDAELLVHSGRVSLTPVDAAITLRPVSIGHTLLAGDIPLATVIAGRVTVTAEGDALLGSVEAHQHVHVLTRVQTLLGDTFVAIDTDDAVLGGLETSDLLALEVALHDTGRTLTRTLQGLLTWPGATPDNDVTMAYLELAELAANEDKEDTDVPRSARWRVAMCEAASQQAYDSVVRIARIIRGARTPA